MNNVLMKEKAIVDWMRDFLASKGSSSFGDITNKSEVDKEEVSVTFNYITDYYSKCLRRLRDFRVGELDVEKCLNNDNEEFEALKKIYYSLWINNPSGNFFSYHEILNHSDFDKNDGINGVNVGVFTNFKNECDIYANYLKENSFSQNNKSELLIEKVFMLLENYYTDYKNKGISIQDYKNNKSLSEYLSEDLSKYFIDAEKCQDFVKNSVLPFLIKHNRYGNLKAKYAHTGRMCYITEKQLEKSNFDPRLSTLIIESVLYHDIGRFYQAIYYPDYIDKKVKEREANGINDHAAIGYYYSLQNLITRDLYKGFDYDDGNYEFVMHSLMSVPIRYHQVANSIMPHYDVDYSDLILDDNNLTKLSSFIKKCYDYAPPIVPFKEYGLIESTDEQNRQIARIILDTLSILAKEDNNSKKIDESLEKLINYSKKYFNNDELFERIRKNPKLLNDSSFLEKLFLGFGDNAVKIINIIMDNNDINYNNFNIRFSNLKEKVVNRDFARFINDYLQFENTINHGAFTGLENNCFLKLVVDKNNAIIQDLEKQGKVIPDFCKKIDYFSKGNGTLNKEDFDLISKNFFGEDYKETLELCKMTLASAVTLTTDIDKLDIFVQRANGSWQQTNNCVYHGNFTELSNDNAKNLAGIREAFFQKEKDPSKSFPPGNSNTSPIRALWFHCDQFICTNMRNYNSFKTIKDLNLLQAVYEETCLLQEERNNTCVKLENGERRLISNNEDSPASLSQYIKEPLAFCEMFVETVLNTRIDDKGNLILPEIKLGEFNNGDHYACYPKQPEEGKNYTVPTFFNADQIQTVRSQVIGNFCQLWEYNQSKTSSNIIMFKSEPYAKKPVRTL